MDCIADSNVLRNHRLKCKRLNRQLDEVKKEVADLEQENKKNLQRILELMNKCRQPVVFVKRLNLRDHKVTGYKVVGDECFKREITTPKSSKKRPYERKAISWKLGLYNSSGKGRSKTMSREREIHPNERIPVTYPVPILKRKWFRRAFPTFYVNHWQQIQSDSKYFQ